MSVLATNKVRNSSDYLIFCQALFSTNLIFVYQNFEQSSILLLFIGQLCRYNIFYHISKNVCFPIYLPVKLEYPKFKKFLSKHEAPQSSFLSSNFSNQAFKENWKLQILQRFLK